ncbi:MAG: murein biosynthesis integral membrane protein MurJ [Ardenticatenaceae bacterium]|nr:murein biosynthesis integral membrane protein MurJ [Ardenticatenaceae bacterium]HBY92843.1 murein biosynthesis integral membrane protein MurJ [Chloroflexota bacterium]
MAVDTSRLTQQMQTDVSVSRRGIARAAGIIGLGNVASRALGLIRETTIANQFGAGPLVDAFVVAATVPTTVYDLLVGGLLSSALVPVFSEYAASDDDPDALWRLASIVLSAATAVLAVLGLILMLFAPQVVALMASGFDADQRALTAGLIRILVPAIFFLGLSGILMGLLYALKRFSFPAFGAAVYNLGIILGALVISRFFSGPARIYSLGLGILLGSTGQFLLMLPDLRDARLRLTLVWNHPGLRRILTLYVPIGLSVVVANLGVVIDRNLASTTGAGSLSWMRYATTLQQLPLGIVAVAVSQAVLPSLARLTADEQLPAFQRTLQHGLRMVLVLMLPAAVGLFVLAEPIIRLLFQHGDFSAFDTIQTAAALRIYLLGMVAAAIDQPLIFAFYARQNTWTPAMVGVAGVGIYLVFALLLIGPTGYLGLVFASSMQLTGHALIMLWLLHRQLRGPEESGLPAAALKSLVAALLMGLATWAMLTGLHPLFGNENNLEAEVLLVIGPAFVGALTYAALVVALRLEEATEVVGLIRRR